MSSYGAYTWASEPEEEFYRQAVRACLEDGRPHRLLHDAQTVTAEAVTEAMCTFPHAQRVLGSGRPAPRHSVYQDLRRLSDLYRWALPAPPSLREIRRNQNFRPWAAGAALYWVTAFLLLVWASPPVGPLIGLLWFAVPALVFARRVPPSPPAPGSPHARLRAVRAALLGPVTSLLWIVEWLRGLFWLRELRSNGLQQEVERAVEGLIGRHLGTLLVTGSHEGLRSLHGGRYFVPNRSTVELQRKMEELTDGTIAVSGPRGVGKSTLMASSMRSGDFSVLAHAPATYKPEEFLISLFIGVCRAYIVRAGHRVPELVRLSYLHRVRRRVLGPFKGLPRLLPYGLPAAALVGIGMFAATKHAVAVEHGVWGWQPLVAAFDRVAGFVRSVLRGDRPAAAVTLTLAGGLLWRLRHSRSFAGLVRATGAVVLTLVAFALLFGAPLSVFFDPGIRRHFGSLPDGQAAPLTVLLMFLVLAWSMCWLWYASPSCPRTTLRVLGRELSWRRCIGALGTLFPFGILALIIATESLRPLLTDDQSPFRLGAFLLGLLIGKFMDRSWRLPRIPSGLVTECRNQLYRLQTVQSSTAALSSGVTQLLTLGTAHTSGFTSVPPVFPLLVADFKVLLAKIAAEEQEKDNRVVIAIDEVDRLGSDTEALAFLADVKAILGVEHVHYLISVAEDVGATFLRRGLPHRDVTDSSLDDVLHVLPCTLAESAQILTRRVEHIYSPYVALAHALSGGITRDLIRYARRLMETREDTDQVQLPRVASALIIEELSKTLSGLRTLLAREQRQPGVVGVLETFRSLTAHLAVERHRPDAAGRLSAVLLLFVRHEAAGLPDESRQLVDEARAYVAFCLTLLEVFAGPDFGTRLTAAARRADGCLELLAEARRELAVSPHGARIVIDEVRRAWQLERLSAPGASPVVVIAPPRGTSSTATP